ncbi:MAG TPA: DNA-binding response regulator, partial [Dehalococcoidia bacterium]|nr:DNA-binding response regulator [Dehalococcoidia bacterium]
MASNDNFKILFVDDKVNVRSFVGPAIKSAGYQYLEAEDGPAALYLIEEEQPDLVVLDIMLED